jgi:hypothetical protein
MRMQWAYDHAGADNAVGEWAAAMRAGVFDRTDAVVAMAENRDTIPVDREASPLTARNQIDSAE